MIVFILFKEAKLKRHFFLHKANSAANINVFFKLIKFYFWSILRIWKPRRSFNLGLQYSHTHAFSLLLCLSVSLSLSLFFSVGCKHGTTWQLHFCKKCLALKYLDVGLKEINYPVKMQYTYILFRILLLMLFEGNFTILK